jgi:hypothetical protein
MGEPGHIEDAVAVLRPLADAGDRWTAEQLVALLANNYRLDELELEVAAGTLGRWSSSLRSTIGSDWPAERQCGRRLRGRLDGDPAAAYLREPQSASDAVASASRQDATQVARAATPQSPRYPM